VDVAELGQPAVHVRIDGVTNGADSNLCQFVSRERLHPQCEPVAGVVRNNDRPFCHDYANGEKCPAAPAKAGVGEAAGVGEVAEMSAVCRSDCRPRSGH
jgi:hypothetical protein